MSRRLLRISSDWRSEKPAEGRFSGASPAGVCVSGAAGNGDPRMPRTADPGDCPNAIALSFVTDISVTTSLMMLILENNGEHEHYCPLYYSFILKFLHN